QVRARIAVAAVIVVVAVLDIDQHHLAVVRQDARTAHHVAVAVADGDDLRAVRTRDDLTRAAARQLLVIDVVAIEDQPVVVRALDEHPVVDLDDRAVVVEFADNLSVLAALATLPTRLTALFARVAELEAAAFLGRDGLDAPPADLVALRRL